MKLKFWVKESNAEQNYEKIINLQLREKCFEKRYFDTAAKLEKQRKPGEYIR